MVSGLCRRRLGRRQRQQSRKIADGVAFYSLVHSTFAVIHRPVPRIRVRNSNESVAIALGQFGQPAEQFVAHFKRFEQKIRLIGPRKALRLAAGGEQHGPCRGSVGNLHVE